MKYLRPLSICMCGNVQKRAFRHLKCWRVMWFNAQSLWLLAINLDAFPQLPTKARKMKRNYLRYSCFSPFMLWGDLATTTLEIMLASAQVIGHRTGRMARAGPAPNARDRREFALMGQEKLEAGVASASAMAAQLMTLNPLLGARAVEHTMSAAAAVMSLAASRSVGQAMARHAKLVRTLTKSAATTTQLSSAAARLARRGLIPIHSRATANAKRLAKR